MRRPAPALLLILPMLFLHPRPARAQLFLSPQLDARVGYTSNRFLTRAERGSTYVAATPGVDVTWFASEQCEANGQLAYAHTRYQRADFGHRTQAYAGLGINCSSARTDVALALNAGTYRDSELELDDSYWWQLAPSVALRLAPSWTASLGADLTYTRYAERTTRSGESEHNTYVALHPGITWFGPGHTSMWAQVIAEHSRSNEITAEFSGVGGIVGVDHSLCTLLRVGAWVQYIVRSYRDPYHYSTAERTDTPLTTSAWAEWRLAPWVTATLTALWAEQNSDNPVNDYREWSTVAGIELIYDWAPLE